MIKGALCSVLWQRIHALPWGPALCNLLQLGADATPCTLVSNETIVSCLYARSLLCGKLSHVAVSVVSKERRTHWDGAKNKTNIPEFHQHNGRLTGNGNYLHSRRIGISDCRRRKSVVRGTYQLSSSR